MSRRGQATPRSRVMSISQPSRKCLTRSVPNGHPTGVVAYATQKTLEGVSMAVQTFIVSVLAPAAIGPISEFEFPYEGVKARVMGPGAVIEVQFSAGHELFSYENGILAQVADSVKALWPVSGYHGWRSVGYHEYDNGDVKGSMEVLEMDFEAGTVTPQ